MFFYDHSEHRNILVSINTKTSGIYYSENALHWLPTVAITAFNYSVYLSIGINNDFSRTTIVNQELHMHNQSHQPTQTYTLYTNPHLHPSNHACMGNIIHLSDATVQFSKSSNGVIQILSICMCARRVKLKPRQQLYILSNTYHW